MTRHGSLVVLALLAGFTPQAPAATGRQEITPAQIAAAITAAGVDVSTGQVLLLSDVVATTDTPVLKVESLEPLDSSRMRVRLRCADSHECLPFVVAIRRDKSTKSQASNSRNVVSENAVSRKAESRNAASSAMDSQAGLAPAGWVIHQPAATAASSKTLTVRAGTTAILLLDGGHVHIRLTVICLESGAAGQTIRVSGKVNRLVYVAEVGSDGILRGKL